MRIPRAAALALPLLLSWSPVALAQEPPAPPEPPGPVGDVDLDVTATPSGAPLPPDGSAGSTRLDVAVTCRNAVVLTGPIQVALAFDAAGGPAYDARLDPPTLNFTWDPPVCAEGTVQVLPATLSFRFAPTELFKAAVPMRVVATSENAPEAAVAEWAEVMGFAGTASASVDPRVPVKTDATNEVPVQVENDANADLEYRIQVEGDFPLAHEVFTPAPGTVASALQPGADGRDFGVVSFRPTEEGDAALLLRVTFVDPRDGTSVLHEALVSTTIVSHPDNDASRAPERGGAPGPALAAVVLAVVAAAALGRRER